MDPGRRDRVSSTRAPLFGNRRSGRHACRDENSSLRVLNVVFSSADLGVEAPLTTRSLPLHCAYGEAEEEVDTSNADGFAWDEVK